MKLSRACFVGAALAAVLAVGCVWFGMALEINEFTLAGMIYVYAVVGLVLAGDYLRRREKKG